MERKIIFLLLLPSVGSSLSVRSNFNNPPDPPCLEFAKPSSIDNQCGGGLPGVVVGCPRYDAAVFDGRVCLGCFRDDYEINHWDRMSFAEKAYALEDASDRAQSKDVVGNDEDPVEGLKFQASLWRALAEKESQRASLKRQTDTDHPNQTIDADSYVVADCTRKASISIPSSVVAVSTKTPTAVSTPTNTTQNARSGEFPNEQEEEEGFQHNENLQESLPPPTPCTRICRYNADCYDGKVCIGCFRDTHDIAQWSGMSPIEKMFSLEDAADRCRDLSETGKDTDTFFEGGITEAALRRQATQWSSAQKQ